MRTNILDELRRRLFSDQGIAYARKKLAERLGEVERPQVLQLARRIRDLAAAAASDSRG